MSPASAQGALQDLGTLGGLAAHARDVSADGSVVVGWSWTTNGIERAFRWDTATGMTDIGSLAGGYSRAYGVSADGSVIVGWSWTSFGEGHAFRWDAATGMQDLGTLGPGSSTAYDVSPDGSVIVGESTNASGQTVAFRWTSAAGMQSLGILPGTQHSSARSVSDDGSVIVGGAYEFNTVISAFRWTEAAGMQTLDVPGWAHGVSGDGSIVVGEAFESLGSSQAFRWTEATGPTRLGMLPGTSYSSAFGISTDGSVIVGDCPFVVLPPGRAFRWTGAGGMQRLGAVPNGFLAAARRVNSDGSVVIGELVNPQGQYRAFRWTSSEVGTRYCPPAANSTGRGSLLNVLGSQQVADRDVTLAAEFLPQHSFGHFLASRHQGAPIVITGSQGPLCLGGFIGRLVGPGQVVDSGATGTFSIDLDITAMPALFGTVAIQPGETWNFQAWHRDMNPMPTSNFTDAVSVTFL